MLAILGGCASHPPPEDQARQSANLTLRDITFESAAPGREMTYRVYIRKDPPQVAIFLLHGGGGSFRDWSNYSEVAAYTDGKPWLLVMPEAGNSYHTNSAARPQDRFEDYIVRDLIAEVDRRFPKIPKRAVVGVSMGGFGAINFAFKHPELFQFAAGLSPALDVPRRQFSLRRAAQWNGHAAIFGPQESSHRRANDPFVLVRTANPKLTPFLYMWTGEQEGLLAPNREFAKILDERQFRHSAQTSVGAHDWRSWNLALPGCLEALNSWFNAKHT